MNIPLPELSCIISAHYKFLLTEDESEVLGQTLKELKLTLKVFLISDCIYSIMKKNGRTLIVFLYFATGKGERH